MKRNRILILPLLIFTMILINRCAPPRYEIGRTFLVQGSAEEVGYGLYSYLLFSERPNNLLLQKYKATLEACLYKIPEIESLENYTSKDSLNIFYIPLINAPNPNFSNYYTEEKVEWIIDNYDYGRARIYLNKFEENLDSGPYIISYTKALSQENLIKERYLIQDLSYAHHRVIALWIDEFLKQSRKARFWDEKELQNFSNDLRNSIAIAADGLKEVAESLAWWKDSLKKWIALK